MTALTPGSALIQSATQAVAAFAIVRAISLRTGSNGFGYTCAQCTRFRRAGVVVVARCGRTALPVYAGGIRLGVGTSLIRIASICGAAVVVVAIVGLIEAKLLGFAGSYVGA